MTIDVKSSKKYNSKLSLKQFFRNFAAISREISAYDSTAFCFHVKICIRELKYFQITSTFKFNTFSDVRNYFFRLKMFQLHLKYLRNILSPWKLEKSLTIF